MDTTFAPLRIGTPIGFQFERGAGSAPSAPPRPASTSSSLLMRILDQLDYGLMLVTDKARVRFANQAALRQCTPAHCMAVSDGHVYARQRREQQSLLQALAAACSGRRSLLTFQSNDSVLSLAVVPVSEMPTWEAAAVAAVAEASTLLVFGRRQVCEPLSVEFFAREHRLTTTETAVLRGLASGLRPSQIAREAGVALSTVRSHVSNVRVKTGARSISELVRMVTVLPPIVSVVGE